MVFPQQTTGHEQPQQDLPGAWRRCARRHFGLYELQLVAWPLPQGWPHSAQTHRGSGACENAGFGVLMIIADSAIPDNTNTTTSAE